MTFDCAVVGLFEGIELPAPGAEPRQVKWLLRVLPQTAETRRYQLASSAIPTLYGASLAEDGSIIGYVRAEHAPDRSLIVYENFITSPDIVRKYDVVEFDVDAEASLAKIRAIGRGGERLSLVCDADLRSAAVKVSLYVGVAVPDPELAAFMIPTNPIEWVVLTRQGPRESSTGTILAAVGHFVSGDVASQPTVLYSIAPARSSSGASCDVQPIVDLVKTYEPTPETAGWSVEYSARHVKLNGQAGLAGKWTNPTAGTRGFFACAAQAVSMNTPLRALECDELRAKMPIGSLMLRWEGSGRIVSFDAMVDGQDDAIVDVAQRAALAAEDSIPSLFLPYTMSSLCGDPSDVPGAAGPSGKL